MNYTTKGKWTVGITFDNGWPVYRLRDMENPKNPLEYLANADLIEAAPDMYELLKRLLHISFDTNDENFEEVSPLLDEANKIYRELSKCFLTKPPPKPKARRRNERQRTEHQGLMETRCPSYTGYYHRTEAVERPQGDERGEPTV